MGYERRKEVLHNASRGWVNYFKYADSKTHLQALDEWLRRRIRMCIVSIRRTTRFTCCSYVASLHQQ